MHKPRDFDDEIPRIPRDSHLKILKTIRGIPRGYVCTYGKIAEAAGLPRRARLVGSILRNSSLAGDVPWHRVVNATGRISLRAGDGPETQSRRLAAEGVEIDSRGRIDLGVHLWQFSKKRKVRARRARPTRAAVVVIKR